MKKIIIGIIVWLILFGMVQLYISETSQTELLNKSIKPIEVKHDQTLWEIASVINDGTYNNNMLISAIKEMNNMESVIIKPGQVIKVPVIE